MDSEPPGSFWSSVSQYFQSVFFICISSNVVFRIRVVSYQRIEKVKFAPLTSHRNLALHYFHICGFHSLAQHQRRGRTSAKFHINLLSFLSALVIWILEILCFVLLFCIGMFWSFFLVFCFVLFHLFFCFVFCCCRCTENFSIGRNSEQRSHIMVRLSTKS